MDPLELVLMVGTIGAIFAAIFYFMFRALRNARHLWVGTPLHEREWWVVVLVAVMVLIGAAAGHSPGVGGKIFRSAPHTTSD
ncbi:hypothetical protein GIW81_06215 [Hyphomicrobium sp. xq]|uniref:Uncharacterized protein n=1 Tax=Hyphomicrobium album TaxID=2665159 RepID=A0A6I3KHX7_9HYPH|nr:hypothetical protein [Hyphomicrobium album]MTD93929.1 hypothetical protein [Hyphomicrobium album]